MYTPRNPGFLAILLVCAVMGQACLRTHGEVPVHTICSLEHKATAIASMRVVRGLSASATRADAQGTFAVEVEETYKGKLSSDELVLLTLSGADERDIPPVAGIYALPREGTRGFVFVDTSSGEPLVHADGWFVIQNDMVANYRLYSNGRSKTEFEAIMTRLRETGDCLDPEQSPLADSKEGSLEVDGGITGEPRDGGT